MKGKDVYDLFTPAKTHVTNPEKVEERIRDLSKVFDSMILASNRSVYVLDCLHERFLYISPGNLILCGYAVEEAMQMEYAFYAKIITADDAIWLNRAHADCLDFYRKLPCEEQKEYIIEYNFDIHHVNGNKNRTNHKFIPLFVDEEKTIQTAICIVSLSLSRQDKTALVKNIHSLDEYICPAAGEGWTKNHLQPLTHKELTTLQLSAQGCTNHEIALFLNQNLNNVKYYKRSLFDKLKVTNIREAVALSLQMGVL
jgi:DNA-binding CsgD family transcriptional regulator